MTLPAPGQIVKEADGSTHLWWILPDAKAGQAQTWTAKLAPATQPRDDVFTWQDTLGKHLDLLFNGKRVTRYMYEFDASDKRTRFMTAKPFHHVFDAEGKDVITSPGGQPYPHHRGIFIGWSKLGHGGKRYDLWHVRNVEQVHQKFIERIAGPVLARSTAKIVWRDTEDQALLVEERTTTVFRQPPPTIMLMLFDTKLTPARGDVMLDGDPEHAGMQYRPHPDVNKNSKKALNLAIGQKPKPNSKLTLYQFPADGINPSRELKRNKKRVPLAERPDKDLPWVAMSYWLRGQRYTVLHMNHPSNPKPTVYSAYRNYGRFGAFFKKKIKAGETLKLTYGICVMEGDMPPRAALAKRYAPFAAPPSIEVAE